MDEAEVLRVLARIARSGSPFLDGYFHGITASRLVMTGAGISFDAPHAVRGAELRGLQAPRHRIVVSCAESGKAG
jgi:hypothetical protein